MRGLATLAFLMIPTVANAAGPEGSYYCRAEASGGVKWVDNEWKGVSFNTKADDFVLKVEPVNLTGLDNIKAELKGQTLYSVVIAEIAREQMHENCGQPEMKGIFQNFAVIKDQVIDCSILSTQTFKISMDTLRFMEIYSGGYIDGKDGEDNTPSVTVGTCARVD
jgi:hypothetical protein